MARVARIQNGFSGGELSPGLDGRTDIEKYQSGAKTLLNFIPTAAGPAHNRTGSRYVAEVSNSANKSALYRFVFSDNDAYVLEFSGDGNLRIIREDGTGAPGLITAQNQTVDLDDDVVDATARTIFFKNGHGFMDGDGPYRLTTTGVLPTGYATGTDYFIRLFPVAPFAAADVNTVVDTIDLSAAALTIRDGWGPYRFNLGSTAALGDYIPNRTDPLTDWYLNTTGASVCEFFTSRDLSGTRLDITDTGAGGTSGDLTCDPTPYALRAYAMLALTAGGAPVNPSDAGSGGTMTLTHQGTAPVVSYSHPYSETEIFELRIRQSGAKLFITHPSHRPRTLERLSIDSWVFDRMPFYDGPYLEPVPGPNSSRDQGGSTLDGLGVSKAAGQENVMNVTEGPYRFVFEDFDRPFTFETEEAPAATHERRTWGLVVGATTDKQIELMHLSRFDANGNPNSIRFGAFSDQEEIGWPKACAFFEQRFVLAGSLLEPQVAHLSVQGDFFTFSPSVLGYNGTTWSPDSGDVLDTNAVTFEIASEEAADILWMRQFKGNLLIGTVAGVFNAGGSVGETITPLNARVFSISTDGTADADAIVVENLLLYISRSKKLLLAVGHSIQDDDLSSRDLTLLADHITGTGIEELAYAKEPDRQVWARRTDGTLACQTLWDAQEVNAWSRHILAGTGPGGSGDAEVESIVSIPSINLAYDSLYMVVRRRIDGADVRYIERFEPKFVETDDPEDQWFLDSAIVVTSGLPLTTVTGLDHLEGESVYALRDGIVDGPHTVASGQITMSDEGTSKIIVGLQYNADMESLRVLAPQPDGTGQARAKAIRNLVVRVRRSFGGQIGPDSASLRPLLRRKLSDDVNAAPALQSLDQEVSGFDSGVEGDPRIFLRQHLPLHMEVLALIYDADVKARPGGGG